MGRTFKFTPQSRLAEDFLTVVGKVIAVETSGGGYQHPQREEPPTAPASPNDFPAGAPHRKF
jgi:hypothetical protein